MVFDRKIHTREKTFEYVSLDLSKAYHVESLWILCDRFQKITKYE